MYLTIKELSIIYKCCSATATNIRNEILTALKLQKKKVSIFDVARYEGITTDNIQKMLSY
jgi:hypothetical protein